jgi:hypothetical protein
VIADPSCNATFAFNVETDALEIEMTPQSSTEGSIGSGSRKKGWLPPARFVRLVRCTLWGG